MTEENYWLISYYCVNHTAHFGECAHKGSIGQWRVDCLKYADGPYVLLSAHALTKKEFDQLDGVIG